jgi:2'-5' RNA ligase
VSSEPEACKSRTEKARVFFALWPPGEVAAYLAALASAHAAGSGGRATRRETIHLTLAFIGDLPIERLPELQGVASTVRGTAFELTLDRFGLWRHNGIIWAGPSVVPPALGELASTLTGALQKGGFSVADAGRTFTPHLTLVRKVKIPDPPLPVGRALVWPCRRFLLVRSNLLASGAFYETLAEFPLS